MSEPLDLDALEREHAMEFHFDESRCLSCRLIAELRACREELADSGYVAGVHQPVVAAEWKDRAERAEAAVETLKVEARNALLQRDEAEATIARVEALAFFPDETWRHIQPRLHAALRGDQ